VFELTAENAKIAESTAATEDGGWKELDGCAFEIGRRLRTNWSIAVQRSAFDGRPVGPASGNMRQQILRTSNFSKAPSFSILSAICPTPIAQWCAGPAMDH